MFGETTNLKDKKQIWISGETLFLLKQKQQKTKEVLGKEMTYDEIVKLSIDQPIVVIGNGQQNPKKKRFTSIFDMPIGRD